jgi:hypothetical protein
MPRWCKHRSYFGLPSLALRPDSITSVTNAEHVMGTYAASSLCVGCPDIYFGPYGFESRVDAESLGFELIERIPRASVLL